MEAGNSKETFDKAKYIETVVVDGHPFPPIKNIEENFRDILKMKPRNDDIFLSAFPKCGSTWTQYIIWEILHDGAPIPNANEMMLRDFVFLEFAGVQAAESMGSPRTMKLHLPYRFTPVVPEAKYISVMRNPFDCCVSFYHQLSAFFRDQPSPYTFETFFDDFLLGRTPWGDYIDFVQSWYERREEPNILFLQYENLKKNHEKGVMDIGRFLGSSYEEQLERDPSLFRTVLERTSFEYMKANAPFRVVKDEATKKILGAAFVTSTSNSDLLKDDNLFKNSNFYRKGTVGSSKTELTKEQWNRLENYVQNGVKYPELCQMMLTTS